MFKVGDKVKIIRCSDCQPQGLIGTTGVITETFCAGYWRVGRYIFDKHDIELIPVNFATPAPQPAVARSQQWLADRLSEAENEQDEHWLGEGA